MKASIPSAALSVSLVFPGVAIPASQAAAAAEDTSNPQKPGGPEGKEREEGRRATGPGGESRSRKGKAGETREIAAPKWQQTQVLVDLEPPGFEGIQGD